MFKRTIKLPKNCSFILWGARQTGKTTLLKYYFRKSSMLKKTIILDLLHSEEYRRYKAHPELLREEVLSKKGIEWVVIDEVQKTPQILNEVHWLMENTKIKFALCGSSIRQFKRTGVHLLGGRAVRYTLYGLTAKELGHKFQLRNTLKRGYLPLVYTHPFPKKILSSYIADYLKQEITSEALVRNLTPFSDFLEKAAISDTEVINYSTFARDCGVSSHTIKEYYFILSDTLLGSFLPSYKKQQKRLVIKQPKFYFSDIGIVNSLTHRFSIHEKNASFGKAFENWVFHELKCAGHYYHAFDKIHYWKQVNGAEVDFIIDDMKTAIEAKAVNSIRSEHLKGLRKLAENFKVKKRIIVCCEPKTRKTEDGILILPYKVFQKDVKSLLC